MEKLSLKDIRKIQIEILNEFVMFCTEFDIEYYLGYGTLLGAIRHKGFIPWDDDIDIKMPRKDYEILIERFNLYSKDYKVASCTIEKKYPYPFVKIYDLNTKLVEDIEFRLDEMGVNIDIFPLDGAYKSKLAQNIHFMSVKAFRGIFRLKAETNFLNIKNKLLLNFFKILLKPISINIIAEAINKISSIVSFESSEMVGCYVWGYGKREVMPKCIFLGENETTFENNRYKIPYDYHDYLSRIYGDYMTLPPKEMQVTHHNYNAYRLEKNDGL